jgi:adenylosuccinate synthase
MAVDLLLGLQWGDEGKGKIVDVLTSKYDIIARFQGGPNAGHTLEFDGIKHVLRTIPSGIFHKNSVNIIGNGVVIDPVVFKSEIDGLAKFNLDIKNKLIISRKAHLILPTHRLLDAASEAAKGKAKIGSTLKGIGPTYMDKTGRNGLRVGDILHPDFMEMYNKLRAKHYQLLGNFDFQEEITEWENAFFEAIEFIKGFKIVNGEYFINEKINNGMRVLAEGAQGSMLDVDFGTFPFVTSSNTISAGVCSGLGIAPQKIKEIIGITKAYCTRVGSGPFPTELFDDKGEFLRKTGNEFGSTTGRPRRCGWIDLVALNFACMINGVTKIVMTKADIMDELDTLEVCTAYLVNGVESKQVPFQMHNLDLKPIYQSFKGWNKNISNIKEISDMPEEMKTYISFINAYLNVEVKYISNGPGREQLIVA